MSYADIKNRESGMVEIKQIFATALENTLGINSNWLLADEGDMLKQSVPKIYEPPVPYKDSGIDKAHILTSRIMTSKHPEIAGALMKNLEQFAAAVGSADELATCQIMLKEQDKKIKEMDMKIKGLQDQVSELLRRELPKNSVAPGDTNQSSKEVAI